MTDISVRYSDLMTHPANLSCPVNYISPEYQEAVRGLALDEAISCSNVTRLATSGAANPFFSDTSAPDRESQATAELIGDTALCATPK
jgi:hypothetical protein